MSPLEAMQGRFSDVGRRIDRLGARARAGNTQARYRIERRVDALHEEQGALARAAVRDAVVDIDMSLRLLETAVDVAEQSTAADVAGDTGSFVDAVAAELRHWYLYLERFQVMAAAMAGGAREQAEAVVSDLRRRWSALSQRLGELRSAPAEAWGEASRCVQMARDELEQSAAAAQAWCRSGSGE